MREIPACLALAAALAVAGCEQAPPPKPAPKAPPKAQAVAPTPVAANPAAPAWPPARNDADAVAANLFAKNYYVVFDGSGSMNDHGCSGNQSKIEAAKAALATFSQALPADANLGLLVFDGSGVRERLPLGTGNREQFTRVVNSVRANAGTPLGSSVRLAYSKLLAQGAKQLGYGEYHLVIVTDGAADQGNDPTPIVNQLLKESPVVVQTIGFCIGKNHSLNQAGRTIYRAADNPEELRQGLADVLAEAPQFTVTEFKK
jgi:Ca-activated chloride channel family protein